MGCIAGKEQYQYSRKENITACEERTEQAQWQLLVHCMHMQYLLFPNGRYTDCLSLTYATNKGKMLKLHYKY